MRWHAVSAIVTAIVVVLGSSCTDRPLRAQSAPAGYEPLKADGNGIRALAVVHRDAVNAKRTDNALLDIAASASLNITFASNQPGLARPVRIAAHARSVAAVLIEIADAASLRILVDIRGSLLVDAKPKELLSQAPRPTSTGAQTLPAVRVNQRKIDNSRERAGLTGAVGITQTTISMDAVRGVPSFVEPDVMRALQAMPGVSSRSDWTAGFNVHGGEADQTLTLLDGYPVYNPYHLGGAFSAFIDPLVGDVEFHTGGLPARYGGRLSGVLDVRSRTPVSDSLEGSTSISMLSATTSLGRRFANGRGSWMIGARRSYADAVIKLLHQGTFPYHLQDAQLRIAGQLPLDVRGASTLYASEDRLTDEAGDFKRAGWKNVLAGLTLSRLVGQSNLANGDSTVAEQRLSRTQFLSGLRPSGDAAVVWNDMADNRAAGTLTRFRSGGLTSQVGFDVSAQRFAHYSNTAMSSLNDVLPSDSVDGRTSSWAVHANQVLRPTASLSLDAGVRVESATGLARPELSPRFSASYRVSDFTTARAAVGRYVQWQHSLGREESPIQPFQFWIADSRQQRPSVALDALVSVEHWWSATRFFRAMTFIKRYERLDVPNTLSNPLASGDELLRVTGRAHGLDLLVRQIEGERFSGWVAYSWLHSWRADSTGQRFPTVMDRRHTLNAVGQWRHGARTFAMRALLTSGAPYTPAVGGYARDGYASAGNAGFVPLPDDQLLLGPRLSARLPWYHRVDMSLSRVWHPRRFDITGIGSVMNVMNTKNAAAYTYSFQGVRNRGSIPNLPFIPSVGVTIGY